MFCLPPRLMVQWIDDGLPFRAEARTESWPFTTQYPLVNIQKTMENHHF